MCDRPCHNDDREAELYLRCSSVIIYPAMKTVKSVLAMNTNLSNHYLTVHQMYIKISTSIHCDNDRALTNTSYRNSDQ
jgi:hypothetical protein